MATTSDMNTPEYSSKNNENTHQIPIQFRRIGGRDYGKILREYNKPASWYQPTPITCSIYYYDPLYQRYLQQHFQKYRLNPSPIQVSNQSRTKYTTSSSFYHQQPKSTIPRLPPIITHKKSLEE